MVSELFLKMLGVVLKFVLTTVFFIYIDFDSIKVTVLRVELLLNQFELFGLSLGAFNIKDDSFKQSCHLFFEVVNLVVASLLHFYYPIYGIFLTLCSSFTIYL